MYEDKKEYVHMWYYTTHAEGLELLKLKRQKEREFLC